MNRQTFAIPKSVTQLQDPSNETIFDGLTLEPVHNHSREKKCCQFVMGLSIGVIGFTLGYLFHLKVVYNECSCDGSLS